MDSRKLVMYILMTVLVIAWGLDYVAAKICLDSLNVLILLFFRYLLAICVVYIIKTLVERKVRLRLRDVPLFVICAITGELGYFYMEYTAMDYLSLSLLTLILACVPIVSLLIEKIFFKRKITSLMLAGVFGSLIGVSMIIGADFSVLFDGKIFGYILAFGAVFSWNAYNFMTAKLHDHYSDATLSFYQITCTAILTAPYALTHMPPTSVFSAELALWMIFLGIFSAGLGFIIYVRALDVLGVTPTALFSNFLPISTTIFGWIFFGEMISPLQIIGGAVIISAACVVIWEKGRVDATAAAAREEAGSGSLPDGRQTDGEYVQD